MSIQSRALRYRARIVAAGAAIALSILPATGTVQATAARIPATYYPTGAHITYRPAISNHEMDCMWGFFCEGNLPLFHLYTQDQLHRVSGWAQFAGLRRRGRMVMSFELFSSRYRAGGDLDGTPFSKEAFDDLGQVTRANGYTPLSQQPHLLPAASPGGSIAEMQHLPSSELVVMACWSGTQEVEAIVAIDHGSASDGRIATRDLVHQVQKAAASSRRAGSS